MYVTQCNICGYMHWMAWASHLIIMLSEMVHCTESPQGASRGLKTVKIAAAGPLLLKSYKNNPVAQLFQGLCGVLCWVDKGRLIFSIQRTGWRRHGSHQRCKCNRPWKGQQASYLSILKDTNLCLQIETSYSLVSCEEIEHMSLERTAHTAVKEFRCL